MIERLFCARRRARLSALVWARVDEPAGSCFKGCDSAARGRSSANRPQRTRSQQPVSRASVSSSRGELDSASVRDDDPNSAQSTLGAEKRATSETIESRQDLRAAHEAEGRPGRMRRPACECECGGRARSSHNRPAESINERAAINEEHKPKCTN
jgi:hypothetical protein